MALSITNQPDPTVDQLSISLSKDDFLSLLQSPNITTKDQPVILGQSCANLLNPIQKNSPKALNVQKVLPIPIKKYSYVNGVPKYGLMKSWIE